MTNPDRTDVAVIGGGLAGLTAAVLLGRAGLRVTLVERAAELGGRAITTSKSGARLNIGPHALYRGGVGAQVRAELGISVEGGVPNVAGVATRGGRRYQLPAGAVSLMRTGLLSPKERLAFALIATHMRSGETGARDDESVEQWIARTSTAPRVREVLAALVRLSTYANAPAVISAGAAMTQFRAAGRGVLYPHGGWETLVEKLLAAATSAGVRFLTGRARAITSVDGQRLVEVDGGPAMATRAVVVAAGPRDLAGLLNGAEADAPTAWASEAVPARAACLDVLLRRLPRPKVLFGLGIDQPVYYSVHSAWASLAPEGMSLVSLAKYLPPNDADPAAAEAELESSLDLLQPGWRDVVVDRQFLPSMIVTHGVPLAARGGLAGRPAVAVPGAAGVFASGDWVGDEGQLSDASFASGKAAALAAAAFVEARATPLRAAS